MTDHAHIEELIATYHKRPKKLELQVAYFGVPYTPAHILIDIDEVKESIATLQAQQPVPEQGYATPNTLRDLVAELERPPQYPGLMVFVGPGRVGTDPTKQSAGAAIQYHLGALQHCWLLVGETSSKPEKPDYRGATDIARELTRLCKDTGVKPYRWPVAEPFSAQATYRLLQVLFATEVQAAQVAPHQLICDFTGGTKAMSAGMILACGTQRPMQYMTFAEDRKSSIPLLMQFEEYDAA